MECDKPLFSVLTQNDILQNPNTYGNPWRKYTFLLSFDCTWSILTDRLICWDWTVHGLFIFERLSTNWLNTLYLTGNNCQHILLSMTSLSLERNVIFSRCPERNIDMIEATCVPIHFRCFCGRKMLMNIGISELSQTVVDFQRLS